jgi:hypothetical protein
MNSEINFFETSDLSLAAFLVMSGLTLITAKKNEFSKFIFVLEDPDYRATQLALEYINSDFCKFDNHVRSIKKLIYTK